MLFPTLQFVQFFLLILPGVVLLKPKKTAYKYFLLVVSLCFYAFSGINFLALLIISILINYFLSIVLARTQKRKKSILLIIILINVIYLAFFKYFNFFLDTAFTTQLANYLPEQLIIPQIPIPFGISFYVFRLISYFVDLYRKKINKTGLLEFTNYIIFFPQIGAGPISRPKHFLQYLNSEKKYKYDLNQVIALILSGLIKKYVVASILFEITFNPLRAPGNYSSLDLLVTGVLYGLLIFVDFSGYSDMAIAISRILGFNPLPNFNLPYKATSLKEFWGRWHISLSTWLRDYIYIPLGGNRHGKIRKYLNLLITMIIGGFWHGAGLNFIIWGFLHGVGLIINHVSRDIYQFIKAKVAYRPSKHKKSLLKIFISTITWPITMTFITFTWIFFAVTSTQTLKDYFFYIFKFDFSYSKVLTPTALFLIVLVMIMNFYGNTSSKLFVKIFSKIPWPLRIAILIPIVYLIIMLGPGEVSPFIYFNF